MKMELVSIRRPEPMAQFLRPIVWPGRLGDQKEAEILVALVQHANSSVVVA
jgi:hypothetical protein